ncbi:MAG: biopolymer transporter ExbD [Methylomonas sp.]|nr:biopolymer transporter ExbD [Methylomonas sp.]PPD22359.1 MAG: biopolymer transporter ExbD [Methylomonas sp.]PPD26862.1 MAG: biopolymer transporter ExbD [Methylomonas sp.]PPD38769.1 MAG: biopolymer transporter ExbD [Methylomonas sp.]PPD40187.1 MAG: biopolymer transporter ExbD [Methylomonas sp.]
MDFRRKRRSAVEIGLIPMIDVLLVLLLFFMIATTFRHHTDLKINLPQAEGKDVSQANQVINLFIDAKGEYALASDHDKARRIEDQTLEGLKAALSAIAADKRQLPFIINADGKTPHQAVVTALDAARQVGFTHATFAINPPEQP